VDLVVDIRRFPRSKTNPQYNSEVLEAKLKEEGIGYQHFACLGGFRKPKRDSPNTAWKNPSFRGFADYMLTAEFDACLNELTKLVSFCQAALMCAEVLPWRCHRMLVSDALVVRGFAVIHILPKNKITHTLTKFARKWQNGLLYIA
jgi:uncharacterized protein (DUF488 family)